jgi:PKD repeat protein
MKHFLFTLTAATCLLLAAAPRAHAQLFVDTTYTANQMVGDFFNLMGDCVTTSNITYTGSPSSLAFFEGSASNVGLNAGIMLSSGNTTSAADTAGSSAFATSYMNTGGDAVLEAITTIMPTFDAAVIEFDLVSTDPDLNFVYVFGSEEYPEFVGSSFNDVFGFFVSGPGISSTQNIALIPGTATPVAINNVNSSTNPSFYIDNEATAVPNEIAYDGFTVPLTATVNVVPGETYHVRLSIADVGDSIFDSGVFIGIESLCGGGIIPLAPEFEPEVSGMSVSFQNFTNYGTYWNWDFGDGATSAERHPTHTYAANGTYTVTLRSGNFSGEFVHTEAVTVGSVAIENAIPAKPYTLQNIAANGNISLTTQTPAQVRLVDISGKVWSSQTADAHHSIDLQCPLKGMYLLQIVTNDGHAYSEKIIF